MRIIKIIIEALFWMLMVAGIIGLAMVTFGAGGVFTLLLCAMLLRMIGAIRRRRAASVIAYLEQAVRLNLPLTKMIDAACASESKTLSLRLGDLSKALSRGISVGTSLRIAVPEVGPASTTLIESAERIGRLPHVLDRLVQQGTRRSDLDTTDAAFTRIYPALMAILVTGIVAMLCVFVMPKYETIFHDFGTKLPAITQLMLDIARAAGPAALVVTVVAVLLWGGIALWRVTHPNSAWSFLRGTRDRFLWALPFTHGWVRDRGMADALDLMAEALRAGQPIDHAAAEASSLQVNVVLQKRLAAWAARLKAGDSLDEAARRAQLPNLLAELLAAVRGGEQAINVLDFLSRYYDARFSRTRLLVQAAILPGMVFFFAFIVAFVALALFLPMITLIQSISSPAHHSF